MMTPRWPQDVPRVLRGPTFLLGVASCVFPVTAQPSITNLGVLPGGNPTFAYAAAISADGLVVTGYSSSSAGQRAFRWTAGSGMQSLGILSGYTVRSLGQALSSDGSVVACISEGINNNARACRWTAATGIQSLGVLGSGSASYARAISADGSVIVGSSYAGGFSGAVATRWTAATGMQSLGGDGSTAAAITPDGTVIVGTDPVDGYLQAAFWTSPGVPHHLNVLPGADSSEAFAVSVDGSIAAGYSGDQFNGTFERAVRWTGLSGGGAIEDLGVLDGGDFAIANAMNVDGSIIGGASELPDGYHAFLWTPALGMLDLNTYLPLQGLALTGWMLINVRGISADGSSIVGDGTFNGADRAWIVSGLHLSPPPCYANCDGSTSAPILNVLDFTCFLNRFAAADPAANCDGSTAPPVLNVLDFTCFLNRFAAGCS